MLKLSKAAVVALLSVLLMSASASAQTDPNYVPEEGQVGKDVIWLPTDKSIVDAMMSMARVTPNDYVIDLGSGDGRTVIAAAKLGARAKGIEYNPKLVAFSRQRAAAAGVADRTEFVEGDIFKTDFSDATVLAMFLLDEINLQLRPQILQMKPGTRVVTNTFRMDDWEPDAEAAATKPCEEFCTAYLWYVPGNIKGRWSVADGGILDFAQAFQNFSGTLTSDNKVLKIESGKLTGPQFQFAVNDVVFTGQIDGKRLIGTRKIPDGTTSSWQASRIE